MMTLSPGTDRILKLLAWPAAIWIAYELTWYQQFKLTGNEGSVYLFTILSDWLGTPGGEKPFRLFVAILEIFCAVLVLIPRTRMWGAALSLGTMSGAIFFHVVSPLGIDPYGDGGGLFKEAVFTWFMALLVLFAHRAEALALVAKLRARFLPQAA
ncbi:DoxX family protein [Falsiroseomonas sp. HC035]|uniref:DoxX family protein n=1 Tax=Falsiroseomonas sp. HC035 TaxID=3390999 RepID=UPI003D31F180